LVKQNYLKDWMEVLKLLEEYFYLQVEDLISLQSYLCYYLFVNHHLHLNMKF
jgi:hypothetical protein